MSVRTINLDIVIYREDGLWVAHCLQLDIVAASQTVEEAQSEIMELIKAHTEYTIEHDDWEHFYHPAPERYWALIPKAPSVEDSVIDFSEIETKVPNKVDPFDKPVFSMKNWHSDHIFKKDINHCTA
ncbi:MAG: hypothetical protein IT344_04115 [Candidatus Dadabacteria bacterium]|nr:hypothetical protein [Candidatus Dadabacteria bacterium]HML96587.1 hypothetical protein [Thermodesulfobacteriota bacterium]